jgi:hypothetical protein
MCWNVLASRSPLFSASLVLVAPASTTGLTFRPFFQATWLTTRPPGQVRRLHKLSRKQRRPTQVPLARIFASRRLPPMR